MIMPRLASVILLFSVSCAFAQASTLDEVLRDPAQFHHQLVTVTGFAHVSDDYFAVYRDSHAARHADSRRSVFVALRIGGPNYNRFNNRWVSVTGIVDSTAHGHLGRFSCEILIKKIDLAKHPLNT